MVHMQILSRNAQDVQAELRSAIEEKRMTTFEIEGIRGGLRLRHKRFRGEVRFLRSGRAGPALVSVQSRLPNEEWQLLSALIGRLADRFKNQIAGINIQLESDEPPKMRGRKRRPARRLRARKRAKR
jgi:hypothetical protein